MKRKRTESNAPGEIVKKRKVVSQKSQDKALFDQFWSHLCNGPPETVLEDAEALKPRLKTRNDKTRAWNFIWSSKCPFNDEKQVLQHLVDTKDELICYTGLTRIARISFDLAHRIHKFYIATRKRKVFQFSAPSAVVLKNAIPDKTERIHFLNAVIWSKFKGEFYSQDLCDMTLKFQEILLEGTRVEFNGKRHKFSNFSDLVCDDMVLQYFEHDLIEDIPLFLLNCHNSDPYNAIDNLFHLKPLMWPISSCLSVLFYSDNQKELERYWIEIAKSSLAIRPFSGIHNCPHCDCNLGPKNDELQIKVESKDWLQYFEISQVQECCSKTNVYIVKKQNIPYRDYKNGFKIVARNDIVSEFHTVRLKVHDWIEDLLVNGVSNLVMEYALF